MSTPKGATTAIVVGASISGLLTARVLSEHADRVIVLERDSLAPDPVVRPGVPQGRHAHVLLAAGQQHLERWFPGLGEELRGHGAVPVRTRDMVWHQGGAFRRGADLGLTTLSLTRPLLEHVVRRRLLEQCDNVTIRDGVAVDCARIGDGRVVGVVSGETLLRANLVVDCTGPEARLLERLTEAGHQAPRVSTLRQDLALSTTMLRRRPGDTEIVGGLEVVADGPGLRRGTATLAPVEGGRWMLTLGARRGAPASTDLVGFERQACALPASDIAQLVMEADQHSKVFTCWVPTSRRRHVEHLGNPVPGLVALGDALCTFNPVHGLGITSAALQAQALGRVLARHGLTSPEVAPVFYRRAAEIIDAPWWIAASLDGADPRAAGAEEVGTTAVDRYLAKVVLASHTSLPVAKQLLRVQHMLARPASLFTPRMVARVLAASHRSPAYDRTRPDRHATRPIRRPRRALGATLLDNAGESALAIGDAR